MVHNAEGTGVRNIVGRNRDRRYGGAGGAGVEPRKIWVPNHFENLGRRCRKSNQEKDG